MLGLAGYASSDEEDEPSEKINNTGVLAAVEREGTRPILSNELAPVSSNVPESTVAPSQDAGEVMGPAPGPAMPSEDDSGPAYEEEEPTELSYESTREAIRNLTMPPIPNFHIPPSPPGSPPPGSTKKFAHFLKLKKQGVHFNQRLQNTPALKNPTLFQKLKQHAGISDEEQYATTLTDDIAVPTSFPQWAYAEELNRSQAKIRQRKEDDAKRKPRDAIDFIPASATSASSRTISSKISARSTAEKVLSGLDKEVTRSPQLPGRKR